MSGINTWRMRRLAKEGGWIVLGQSLLILGFLVGIRILTEIMPPAAYGELSLGMTIATLVNQMILGPLGGGITRFYAPAVEQGDLSGYLSASRKLTLYATGIVILITLFAIVGLKIAGQSTWIRITVIAFLFAIVSGVNSILGGIQSAARQRAIVALHLGADPWLRSLVAAGLLLWLGTTSTVAMLGYAIATVLLLASQAYFFLKLVVAPANIENENKWKVDIWKFTWPIGVFGIFTWTQLISDRWALQLFSTTQEVGNYAVLYQLGFYPISLLTGMTMQFLTPILYQRAGDARDSGRNADVTDLCWKLTWLSLGVTLVGFLVTLILHDFIFRVFVNVNYRLVSYLLPWMILAGGIYASGQSLASNLLAKLKTREMMAAKIVTALFGLVFNFIGAYWLGITGIICAGVLFSVMYFLWMVVLVNDGSVEKCLC
ncbi:MAG: lipopolysaccharide biosynthesis protein [Candidatus Methylumidiphilus sp.]